PAPAGHERPRRPAFPPAPAADRLGASGILRRGDGCGALALGPLPAQPHCHWLGLSADRDLLLERACRLAAAPRALDEPLVVRQSGSAHGGPLTGRAAA